MDAANLTGSAGSRSRRAAPPDSRTQRLTGCG